MTYESTEIWIANMFLKEDMFRRRPESWNNVLHRTRAWILIRLNHNSAPTGTPCMCLPIQRAKIFYTSLWLHPQESSCAD